MVKTVSPDTLTEIPYTPVEHALELLRERRKDRALMARIEAELGGDIPPYLHEHECFVLPRHIATPNNEALYVLKQAERYGVMAIFSQDLNDKFTSVNNLKRRLARPEVCIQQNGGLAYRKINLVDVPKAEGLPLREVRTLHGALLADVHNRLFDAVESGAFRVVNDSGWIDRNGRGDLARHYTRYLLLFIAHGILFEDFESIADEKLRNRVAVPCFIDSWTRFGATPILVRTHAEPSLLDERHCLAHANDFFE